MSPVSETMPMSCPGEASTATMSPVSERKVVDVLIEGTARVLEAHLEYIGRNMIGIIGEPLRLMELEAPFADGRAALLSAVAEGAAADLRSVFTIAGHFSVFISNIIFFDGIAISFRNPRRFEPYRHGRSRFIRETQGSLPAGTGRDRLRPTERNTKRAGRNSSYAFARIIIYNPYCLLLQAYRSARRQYAPNAGDSENPNA